VSRRLSRLDSWQQGALVALVIIFILALLAWVIYVRGPLLMVLTPFLVSLILSYLLLPVVHFMERRRITRSLAIIVIYIAFALIVFIFCVRVMPLLLDDLQDLAEQLPEYAAGLQDLLGQLEENYERFNLPPRIREIVDNNIQGLGDALVFQLERSYNFLIELFNRIILLLLVPILTFYFIRDEAYLRQKALELFPARYRRELVAVAEEINAALGAFIRGALLVSLLVGLLTYIGLLILGVNYALVLALIVGITNLIPYIGPIIGALPAIVVAFLDTPLLALKVTILIIIVQQVETQLIAPPIIGHSIRLHPLAIFLALLLGGKLFGFIGLILALPATIILRIVTTHVLRAWRRRS
jgi:sporulation integral membrane protein YtvI